jgi:hypothetical protein
MATRSLIGLETHDGIKYVYCHCDGYPEYQLEMLSEHYQDRSKVEELISNGGMSQLREEIDQINFYKDKHKEVVDIGVCFSPLAYGDKMEKHGCEYAYYLTNEGKWRYFEAC